MQFARLISYFSPSSPSTPPAPPPGPQEPYRPRTVWQTPNGLPPETRPNRRPPRSIPLDRTHSRFMRLLAAMVRQAAPQRSGHARLDA